MARKLSTKERGYGGNWQKLRRVILARDGWTCWVCGGYADCVDHLTPTSKGGTDALDNLRAICRADNTRRMHDDNPGVAARGRKHWAPPTRTPSPPTGALVDDRSRPVM